MLEVYYKKNGAVLFDIPSCVYVLVYIPCLGVPHQSQAQPISLQGIPISSHLSSSEQMACLQRNIKKYSESSVALSSVPFI